TPQEILFDDNDEYINNQNNHIIKEILHKKLGTEVTWITRHIKFCHFLLLEYIQEPKNSKDLSVKKIFLDLYFNDFGTYHTVYYSLGGDLEVVTADLPQGNNLCSIKRHGTNHECCNCLVPREQLSDKNYNHL
ncbi:7500_t:CDS:2, partial [Diversispora eburnea]